MAEAFLGQVMPWPINWAPRDWAYCSGQLIQISQNPALYSLLGTNFGGDGVSTFGLPDLRGRVVVGAGTGTGLSPYIFAQFGGFENVTLSADNLPEHVHPTPASNSTADQGTPAADLAPAKVPRGSTYNLYASPADASLAPTGNNTTSKQPVENRQPWLALNYIICLNGIYPSRD